MMSLAAEADVIVNALPLTDTTRGLLGAEFFSPDVLKNQPYFINVGRGATVDTDALLSALDSGVVAGAGLDVTDPEPLPSDHPLWQSDRVLITPHISSSGSNRDRHQTLVHANILRFLAGDALFNVVDPDKGY
jgi:phosphoglycerate dehydrogenase-like enzyme